MPVMSTSRSMAYSRETERHQPSDLVRLRPTTMCDRVVHSRQGEFADERGVVVVVAAERTHARSECVEKLGADPGEVGREAVREARAVECERARCLGRVRVARLREHTFDPKPNLPLRIV